MRHSMCGKDITLRGAKYSQGKVNSLPSRVGKAPHLASFLAAGPAALHLVVNLVSFTSWPDHTVNETSQPYPALGIKVHLTLLLLQSLQAFLVHSVPECNLCVTPQACGVFLPWAVSVCDRPYAVDPMCAVSDVLCLAILET